MPQVIPGLIGAGGQLIGGLLGGPSQKSTSTTAPNWLPGQQDLMQQLFGQYVNALKMGTGVTQADRNALMTQINNSYATMKPALTSDLVSRGFAGGQGSATSGNLGRGFENIDIARQGAQEQGYAGLQNQAMQRWLSLIGMGPAMGQPFGGTTTTSTGTQQQGLGQTIGGALGGLGTAFALNNPFAPQAAMASPPISQPINTSMAIPPPLYAPPTGGIPTTPYPNAPPPGSSSGYYSPPGGGGGGSYGGGSQFG